MEKNSTVTPLSVFLEIEHRVIKDEKSPFKTMLSKAKDIDIDYFERITRSRGVNRLSEELNLGLKDQVVDAFGKMADSYYVDGGVLHNLPSFYLRPICKKVIGINVSPSKLGPIKMNVRSLAYRTYKLMTLRNVVADKQLCDLLVDIISIQQISTFDTRAANRIAQKGYFETMKILKNSPIVTELKS